MKPSLQASFPRAQIRQVVVNLLYQDAGQVAEQTEGLWTEARAPPFGAALLLLREVAAEGLG